MNPSSLVLSSVHLFTPSNSFPETVPYISGFPNPHESTDRPRLCHSLCSVVDEGLKIVVFSNQRLSMDRSEDGIPHELKERLGSFDAAVSAVESMLQPLLSTSHTDLVEKVSKGRSPVVTL